MKIRKVTIKNFRNLRDVTVFPAKTTVIVGENNAGKSNFIHALRLILDPLAERLRLDLSETDINDTAKKEGGNFFSITVEIGELQNHIEVEGIFRDRIDQEKDSAETFITIEGRYQRNDDGDYEFIVNLMPPTGRKNEPVKMTSRMSKALPLYFLEAMRDAERDTRATGRGVLAQMLEEIDYSDVQEDVQKALSQANEALSSGQQISELTQGISRQLTQLTPGGQSFVKLSVTDDNPVNIRRNFRLGFQKSPSQNLSDLSRHGTGLQNLALVAIFRQRISSSKTGTPILAIEEPEAHLHPHAQRRLFRDLAEIDAPVLITTHSTALVKYADPKGVVLFRTCDDVTTPYQLDRKNIGAEDTKNLELLMRGGRAELFFARSIIIVEGQSELIALPAFAELLGCDFDRDGISLIEAGGNNFAFILKSCGAGSFSIPYVVTYDTDVLFKDNNLLAEACKAGLIDERKKSNAQNCPEQQRPINRKAILEELGWFGAEKCFEEVICREGYMQTVLEAITNKDPEYHTDERELEAFMKRNSLIVDPESIASFIGKRETLKIPVAQAIVKASSRIGCVPLVYERAIRKAVLQSKQGITVDDFFEARSWASGFKNLMIGFLQEKGLFPAFQAYCDSDGKNLPAPLQYQAFFKSSDLIIDHRDELKTRVATAVAECGCPEYSQQIKEQAFPTA